LSDRRVEIAAAMLPVEGAFLTQTFVRDRLALLCCREHALATRKKVGLGELAQESFVAFTDDFKVNDLIVSMVASGMGVALLPESVCRKTRSARLAVVAVVDPVVTYELALVRARESFFEPGGRAWVEIAAKVLKFDVNPSFVD
jgi:DNA-binding transcriptional LysR family regulator